MKKITVIGSMSIDLVVSASKRPGKGETILGDDFFTTPGGKGANQAVAAARLGDNVHMIGRVGDDDFGKEIYENLQKSRYCGWCGTRYTNAIWDSTYNFI